MRLKITNLDGVEVTVQIVKENYANNGRILLIALDEEGYSFSSITTNMNTPIAIDEMILNTKDANAALIKALYDEGLVSQTSRYHVTGYHIYPIVKATEKLKKELEME